MERTRSAVWVFSFIESFESPLAAFSFVSTRARHIARTSSSDGRRLVSQLFSFMEFPVSFVLFVASLVSSVDFVASATPKPQSPDTTVGTVCFRKLRNTKRNSSAFVDFDNAKSPTLFFVMDFTTPTSCSTPRVPKPFSTRERKNSCACISRTGQHAPRFVPSIARSKNSCRLNTVNIKRICMLTMTRLTTAAKALAKESTFKSCHTCSLLREVSPSPVGWRSTWSSVETSQNRCSEYFTRGAIEGNAVL
mmetsp:Transcript_8745/g.29144  ORF Transcript_8745/g.29144 Transcript_8745/m.29144 type:complete len:250 (+) Transcript_8745:336-1085(+)